MKSLSQTQSWIWTLRLVFRVRITAPASLHRFSPLFLFSKAEQPPLKWGDGKPASRGRMAPTGYMDDTHSADKDWYYWKLSDINVFRQVVIRKKSLSNTELKKSVMTCCFLLTQITQQREEGNAKIRKWQNTSSQQWGLSYATQLLIYFKHF